MPLDLQAELHLRSDRTAIAYHRRQRRLEVRQKAYSFGLIPLQGPNLSQVELAEEVRVRLLQFLIASQPSLQIRRMLVLLINRCIETNFWIEHRVILWDNSRAEAILAELRSSKR